MPIILAPFRNLNLYSFGVVIKLTFPSNNTSPFLYTLTLHTQIDIRKASSSPKMESKGLFINYGEGCKLSLPPPPPTPFKGWKLVVSPISMAKTSSSRVKTTSKMVSPPPPLSTAQTFSAPFFVGLKIHLLAHPRFVAPTPPHN